MEDLMRFANLILGVMGGALVAAAGCGTGGGSGAGGSTSSSGSGTRTCAPSAQCKVADKACLGLVDNSGKTKFGLRMSELDITAPPALANGTVQMVVSSAVAPTNAACNLDGTATFSWLLQFDTAAGTLRTGGAKPVMDPTMGYSFDIETITQGPTMFNVAPVTYMTMPDPKTGVFTVTAGQDLIVPIFLTSAGTTVVLLPLHQARMVMGTLSASQNCIGSYNATGLLTAHTCQPFGNVTQFIDGGSLDGYITLEQADKVLITALGQSLCALLAGGATLDGGPNPDVMTGTSGLVCTRDTSNNIVFRGSWCNATNAAATATCYDSVQLTAKFAASSVLINN
jgi:hypothetical protein